MRRSQCRLSVRRDSRVIILFITSDHSFSEAMLSTRSTQMNLNPKAASAFLMFNNVVVNLFILSLKNTTFDFSLR